MGTSIIGSQQKKSIKYEIVRLLPPIGKKGIVYFVPIENPIDDNRYTEWVWVDDAWERVGQVGIDLSDYIRKEEVELLTKKEIENIILPPTKAGDICFYNKSKDKLEIIAFEDWNTIDYPAVNYTPIGVVVIPNTHDVYGTKQSGVISLREMSYDNPNNGCCKNNKRFMCYGYTGSMLINTANSVPIIGGRGAFYNNYSLTAPEGWLPSEKYEGSTGMGSPTDPLTEYKKNLADYIPSPYVGDDRNPQYIVNSFNNACIDFDGIGNTKIILNNVTIDYISSSTISNSYSPGNYPAACCCWRYHTEGTKQGDWYLPASGEFGYVGVRLNIINDTIKALNFYDPYATVLNNTFWTSTEYGKSYNRTDSLGRNSYMNKRDNAAVRAFIRV